MALTDLSSESNSAPLDWEQPLETLRAWVSEDG